MKLSIKKPRAVFWKTDLSVEDIQKMLQAGTVTEEWLVCPQGEVGDAVLISEFLANPSIFGSILQSNSPEKKDESETEPNQNDLKKKDNHCCSEGLRHRCRHWCNLCQCSLWCNRYRCILRRTPFCAVHALLFRRCLGNPRIIYSVRSCDHSVRRPSRQRSSHWSPATHCKWKFCIGSRVGVPGRRNGRLPLICELEKN